MMEVGRVNGSLAWNRAHFGAWCVVSAPLVLGLDLSDRDALAAIVPVVANPEAIAINQQWSGHPGRLVAEFFVAGDGALPVQLWAKPQPGGALAAILLNPTAEPFRSAVDLTLLGLSGGGSWQLRDVWNRKDAGAVAGTIAFDVPPTDSQFFLLSASSS